MATVHLHPGDTLNLVVDIVKTPKGQSNVVMPFVYEDLMEILSPKRRRKNATKPGGKVSRQINLFCQALRRGTWTTGAPIHRSDIADRLGDILTEWLDTDLAGPLTDKAVRSLKELPNQGHGLGLGKMIEQALARPFPAGAEK